MLHIITQMVGLLLACGGSAWLGLSWLFGTDPLPDPDDPFDDGERMVA